MRPLEERVAQKSTAWVSHEPVHAAFRVWRNASRNDEWLLQLTKIAGQITSMNVMVDATQFTYGDEAGQKIMTGASLC